MEPQNYVSFNRQQWSQLNGNIVSTVTNAELIQRRSLDDPVSLEDVRKIYLPLCNLLNIYYQQYQAKLSAVATFSNERTPKQAPFIIGIAGSVAVGKSTIARLLTLLLQRAFPARRIQQITTDGFLYSTAELKKRHLMKRKGFPESYDMVKLISFLNDIKEAKSHVLAPRYSHQLYDIVPNEYDEIDRPDILIVEGINTLQLPANQQVYVSDYFDFSIYVDADARLIEKWFLHRFGILLDSAFHNPQDHYYPYTQIPRDEAFQRARKIWHNIDLVNLYEYILPTKNRATLILHKTDEHVIDKIYLRKF